jgi:hypothetical protein
MHRGVRPEVFRGPWRAVLRYGRALSCLQVLVCSAGPRTYMLGAARSLLCTGIPRDELVPLP